MFCAHCGKQLPPNSKFCPACGNSTTPNVANPNAIPQPGYEAASIGLRFINFFLDRIFSIIFIVIIGLIGNSINDTLGGILIFLAFIGYYLLFEGVWQRTPAKWITKTKVVMNDGSKPDFLHILGRTFARFIPFEPLSFLAGPVGWHDSLSKTLVVPADYTAEQVKLINPKAKGKTSTAVIIIVCGFIGIALIGLLSSVVLLALNSARAKSRDAKRLADVRQVASALELYFNDYSSYPARLSDLETKYIGVVPTAPTPQDGECTAVQNIYTYKLITNNTYILTFCLGAQTGGYSAGVNSLTQKGIESGYAQPDTSAEFNPANYGATPATQPPDTGKDCPGVENAYEAANGKCYCKTGYTISFDSTYCVLQ